MHLRIIICTCAAYFLSITQHTSATCIEQCSMSCRLVYTSPTTSPIRRFWRSHHYPLCYRICSYVCDGQMLQVPFNMRSRHIGSTNNVLILAFPLPFAVEFYDQNGDEQISYLEFAEGVKCNSTDPKTRRAFDLVDINNDQLIDRVELDFSTLKMRLHGYFDNDVDDDDAWARRHGEREDGHGSREAGYWD